MLPYLRQVVNLRGRRTACRRDGHVWTDRAYPPACTACGLPRPQRNEAPATAVG